jgi:hypothetical protein
MVTAQDRPRSRPEEAPRMQCPRCKALMKARKHVPLPGRKFVDVVLNDTLTDSAVRVSRDVARAKQRTWMAGRMSPRKWGELVNEQNDEAFWALDDQQKRALCGSTINPTDALADFDPRHISDAQLAGP